jgi:hypothetical protein
MWEEQSLKKHFSTKHKMSLSDYSLKHLKTYQENEDCSKKAQEFDSWINKCIYRCMLCPEKPEMTRKLALYDHLRKRHPKDSSGYFAKFEDDTFVKKVEHVCQICGLSLLWNVKYLQRHIERTHKMDKSVYRAKFMSGYTEDLVSMS